MQHKNSPSDLATGQFSFPTQYVSEAFADALLSDVRAHQAAILRRIARKTVNAVAAMLRRTLVRFGILGRALANFWNIPPLGPGIRTSHSHNSAERWNLPL
jgi:hypothetical protein